jgi:hypothetical protein
MKFWPTNGSAAHECESSGSPMRTHQGGHSHARSGSWRARQEIRACPGRRDECEPAGNHAVVSHYRGERKDLASGAVAGVVSPQCLSSTVPLYHLLD